MINKFNSFMISSLFVLVLMPHVASAGLLSWLSGGNSKASTVPEKPKETVAVEVDHSFEKGMILKIPASSSETPVVVSWDGKDRNQITNPTQVLNLAINEAYGKASRFRPGGSDETRFWQSLQYSNGNSDGSGNLIIQEEAYLEVSNATSTEIKGILYVPRPSSDTPLRETTYYHHAEGFIMGIGPYRMGSGNARQFIEISTDKWDHQQILITASPITTGTFSISVHPSMLSSAVVLTERPNNEILESSNESLGCVESKITTYDRYHDESTRSASIDSFNISSKVDIDTLFDVFKCEESHTVRAKILNKLATMDRVFEGHILDRFISWYQSYKGQLPYGRVWHQPRFEGTRFLSHLRSLASSVETWVHHRIFLLSEEEASIFDGEIYADWKSYDERREFIDNFIVQNQLDEFYILGIAQFLSQYDLWLTQKFFDQKDDEPEGAEGLLLDSSITLRTDFLNDLIGEHDLDSSQRITLEEQLVQILLAQYDQASTHLAQLLRQRMVIAGIDKLHRRIRQLEAQVASLSYDLSRARSALSASRSEVNSLKRELRNSGGSAFLIGVIVGAIAFSG